MKKVLLTLAAVSLSASVSACSMHHDDHNQQGNWSHDRMESMLEDKFNTMDKNGDGVISKKEYAEYTRQWFKDADTNHDGQLTFDEFKAKIMKEKHEMKHRKHHKDMNNDDTTNNNDYNNGTVNSGTNYENQNRY